MDLTKKFPRSPKVRMGGMVHLPRMIDKARAKFQNTLGEYIFPCPIDDIVLDFLQLKAKSLTGFSSTHTDSEVLEWIMNKLKDKTPEQIEGINRKILERKPESDEQMKKFLEIRNQIDSTRTDVDTWVGLIDLEEGRMEVKVNDK